jgi:hypothetical protein
MPYNSQSCYAEEESESERENESCPMTHSWDFALASYVGKFIVLFKPKCMNVELPEGGKVKPFGQEK